MGGWVGGGRGAAGVELTSIWFFCFILERAALSRLARMRLALRSSMLGSRRGSAAGWRPPLPRFLWGGTRNARWATSRSAVRAVAGQPSISDDCAVDRSLYWGGGGGRSGLVTVTGKLHPHPCRFIIEGFPTPFPRRPQPPCDCVPKRSLPPPPSPHTSSTFFAQAKRSARMGRDGGELFSNSQRKSRRTCHCNW